MPEVLLIALLGVGAVSACTRLTAVDWSRIGPEAAAGANDEGGSASMNDAQSGSEGGEGGAPGALRGAAGSGL
jgi:hypothetical protein